MNYIKILEEKEKLLLSDIKECEVKLFEKFKINLPQNIKDPIGRIIEKLSYVFTFAEGARFGSSLFNYIKNIIS